MYIKLFLISVILGSIIGAKEPSVEEEKQLRSFVNLQIYIGAFSIAYFDKFAFKKTDDFSNNLEKKYRKYMESLKDLFVTIESFQSTTESEKKQYNQLKAAADTYLAESASDNVVTAKAKKIMTALHILKNEMVENKNIKSPKDVIAACITAANALIQENTNNVKTLEKSLDKDKIKKIENEVRILVETTMKLIIEDTIITDEFKYAQSPIYDPLKEVYEFVHGNPDDFSNKFANKENFMKSYGQPQVLFQDINNTSTPVLV